MSLTKSDLASIRVVVSEEVKKSERRVIRKMDFVDKVLDREHVKLVKRVDNIERHVGITPQSL